MMVGWGAVAAGALGGVLGGAAWSVRGRSAQVLAPSIWRGNRERRAVALTFDDGPSEGTAAILEVLREAGARATFFQCGMNVERRPEWAAAVSAGGHEVGNHTWSHRRLDFASRAVMREELGRAQALLTAVHGVAPRWFRAPFGVRWVGLGQVQRELGLMGAMWTCMGRDWKLPAAAIARRVQRGVENGAIICLHDGRGVSAAPAIGETVAALRVITRDLREKGWPMVGLSDLD
ncbi:MAG: polysaccharide deacetylase family protein [Acidobacteriota bacterium]|jgi:peptidoglycan/xylan/chitin deacetylase (PgdA/CDA1 family)|nr:polysaccharide deacetylase family protein [Bryobacteraceae bacterium CoA2 C42]